MSEIESFVNPFGDFERITLEDCKNKFTEEELSMLKECGQHISVRPGYYAFGTDIPEDLLEKLNSLFSKWVNSEVRHKIDKNGIIVEVEVLPQEMKAREHFPDFFEIYFDETELKDPASLEALYIQSGQFEITGLYLTFIQSLGIDIRFDTEEALEKEFNKKIARVIFDDENSAQFLPTHKKYSGALLPLKNKVAYIAKYDRQLQYVWDEDGNYQITLSDEQTAYDELIKNKVVPAECADTDLLMTLAAAVEASYRCNCGYIITVYLPNFARAMGVQFEKDGKAQKMYDLKSKLKDLEDIIGILVEQKKIQFAFKIIELDQEKKELTFASPYLYTIMDLLKNDPITTKEKKNNQPKFMIYGASHLISSKINKARNKATTQVVYYLVAQLHQHGIKTDAVRKPQQQHDDKKLITKEITYKDIIKNSPILKESLQQSAPKRRSQILNRAIFGDDYNPKLKVPGQTLIEKYLRDYTDVFKYWKDLNIKVEPVSMKELDNRIILTHHGLSSDFEDTLRIPSVNGQIGLFDDK